jgi:hypothetical protein
MRYIIPDSAILALSLLDDLLAHSKYGAALRKRSLAYQIHKLERYARLL